jgi:hypothetical protein
MDAGLTNSEHFCVSRRIVKSNGLIVSVWGSAPSGA